MGISTNIYGYFGIKTEWNSEFSEAYEEVYNDTDTPLMLFESMGGKYMIFGHRLYNSGDFRYGMEDGDVFKTIDLNTLPELEAKYKEEFIKKFPQFASIMDAPFQLMIFTHYS